MLNSNQVLNILQNLILTILLGGHNSHYFHFTHGETKIEIIKYFVKVYSTLCDGAWIWTQSDLDLTVWYSSVHHEKLILFWQVGQCNWWCRITSEGLGLAQRCMLLWAPSSWLLVCSTCDKMSQDEAPERSLGGRWSFLGKDATKKGPRTEPRALLTYTRQMAASKGLQNSFTKGWYRRKIKNLVVK